MSNLVEQITNAIEADAQTVLTAAYKKLSFKWDVRKNSNTQNAKRFGCIPQGISEQSPSLIGYLDVQQVFQFILNESYVTKDGNDQLITDKTNLLFDKMDDVLQSLYNTKAGISNVITLITLDGTQPPEIDEEHKIITLRMDLNVRYRKKL